MIKKWKSFGIGLLLLVFGTVAGAYESGGPSIHGFVSYGFMKTDRNNVYVPNSKNGTDPMSEVGLNIWNRLSTNLNVGMQILGRELGKAGNYEILVDWAVGDYQLSNELGFRFGKVKRTHGFYNRGRDVDVLRTWIFLPESMYYEHARDLMLSYTGGGIYGNLSTGAFGDFGYELYGGSLENPNIQYIQNKVNDVVSAYKAGLAPAGFSGTSKYYDIEGEFPYKLGGAVTWYTPVNGLKLGFSHFAGQMNYSTLVHYYGTTATSPTNNTSMLWSLEGSFDFQRVNGYSAEYSTGPLTLTGEIYSLFCAVDATLHVPGVLPPFENMKTTTSVDKLGYYGAVTYQLLDWLQLGSYYSVFYPDKDDPDGSNMAAAGRPKYYGWYKDLTVTARMDLSPNWVLKIENHMVNGAADLVNEFNPEGMKQYWNLLAIKTSYQF